MSYSPQLQAYFEKNSSFNNFRKDGILHLLSGVKHGENTSGARELE